MRIVQTVFGVFHHFELARQLHQRNHLQKLYTTWPRLRIDREGLPRELVDTFPWIHGPDMLAQRFGFSHAWTLDQTSYANALAFDRWTSRKLRHEPPPDALIAISGSSLTTGQELQARGSRFICDRGSSHQRYQERIVAEEYRRWGVSRPVTDIRDILREEKIYQAADAITVPSTFAARSFIEEGLPTRKTPRNPLRRPPRAVRPHRQAPSRPVRSSLRRIGQPAQRSSLPPPGLRQTPASRPNGSASPAQSIQT